MSRKVVKILLALLLVVIALPIGGILPQGKVFASPAWLDGWDKRVKLTIDQDDIDATLSDFPVLVYLSTSSGRNGDDVSFVFDELENDANRKKIAVTKSDGTTECYVEIEKWDDVNEEAWLWVKVPDIANDADTNLYLYYDKDHADNDAYVGDTNDVVAENVWDSNFKLVSHIRDNPDNEHVRDSTLNDNDGIKTAAGEPAVTTSGKIDDAQEFDGTDDHIHVAHAASLDFTTPYTLEAWVYPDQLRSYEVIFCRGAGDADDIEAYIQTSTSFVIAHNRGNGGTFNYESGWTNPPATTWTHVAIVWLNLRWYLYHNGVLQDSSSGNKVDPLDTDKGWIIGATEATAFGATNEFDGKIDEVRISITNRSVAWIKATYETGSDDLLGFGSEEEAPAPPAPPIVPPRTPSLFLFGLLTLAGALTCTMFVSGQAMLGFPCAILWAIVGGHCYLQSAVPWGDIYYYLFFTAFGMTIFTIIAAVGLREKRDTLADEELEKGYGTYVDEVE